MSESENSELFSNNGGNSTFQAERLPQPWNFPSISEAKSGEATEQKAGNGSDSESEKEVKEVKTRKWLYDDEIESAESSDENEGKDRTSRPGYLTEHDSPCSWGSHAQ